jgi:hypothetical protein
MTTSTSYMGVENVDFMVDKLAEGCPPAQFIREFTENAIQAITASGKRGRVLWLRDERFAEQGLSKLSIVDTGTGMGPGELVRYINNLAASGRTQAVDRNYGVGAKISAAARNPEGIIFRSWQDGRGHMVWLHRDADGRYGLKPLNDAGEVCVEVSDADKPTLTNERGVRERLIDRHGTQVVFLGRSMSEDTCRAPDGVPTGGTNLRWISHYLNSRYFTLPDSVEVRVSERTFDGPKPFNRQIKGMRRWLTENREFGGEVELDGGVVAHWSVLPDSKRMRQARGYVPALAHVAVLFGTELYQHQFAAQAVAALQRAGIHFGHRRCVLYFQAPQNDGYCVDFTRSRVERTGREDKLLPLEDWQRAFSRRMPDRLAEFVAEQGAQARCGDADSLKERLLRSAKLFNLTRFRSSRRGSGRQRITHAISGGAQPARVEANQPPRPPQRPAAGGGRGGGASQPQAPARRRPPRRQAPYGGGQARERRAEQVPFEAWIPEVVWDDLSEEIGDAAGRYNPEANQLTLNTRYSVFEQMTDRFASDERFRHVPNIAEHAREVVQHEYAVILCEAIIDAHDRAAAEGWDAEQWERAVSPQALSLVAGVRSTANHTIGRTLGRRFPSAE